MLSVIADDQELSAAIWKLLEREYFVLRIAGTTSLSSTKPSKSERIREVYQCHSQIFFPNFE